MTLPTCENELVSCGNDLLTCGNDFLSCGNDLLSHGNKIKNDRKTVLCPFLGSVKSLLGHEAVSEFCLITKYTDWENLQIVPFRILLQYIIYIRQGHF